MKLRCGVPLFTYVVGSSADSLRLETKFKHDDLSVELSLSGDEPSVSDSLPAHSRHFRKVTSLHLFVEEVGIKGVTKSEYPKMLRILVPIVNRAIRHIRNFGFVPHISEISPTDDDAEYYLGRWEVELSEDGKNWKSVVADTLLATLLYGERIKKTATLHAVWWPDIEEAIQNDLDLPPEQEFRTNAIEHFALRNYRVALLESIICLEVVLTQYLEKYLSMQKHIPRNRIKEFLSPQLGLKARVSVLLPLFLNAEDVERIRFNNVFEAISWRNEVVHGTGHLPEANEETRRRIIDSVLGLAFLLAGKRNQIEASPDMQKIAESISKKHGVPIPEISLLDRHRVLMRFVFFVKPHAFPEKQIMEAVAQEASVQLSNRDLRFNPAEGLYITYVVFPDYVVARWQGGSLHAGQNKPLT